MTWRGERRKQLPSNWGQIRKQVLERDGYQCTAPIADTYRNEHGVVAEVGNVRRCPAQATDVDHVNGPHDHRIDSLRSLCDWHHKQKTQAEAKAAQALKSRARAKQPHPGLR